MIDSLLAALAAIGTLLTAYFMFPSFQSTGLTIDVSVDDVPGANGKGTVGEKLQQAGYFLLIVDLTAAPQSIARPKTIEVRGGKIPWEVVDKYGNSKLGRIDKMVVGCVPIPVVIPHGKTYRLRMVVLPDNPESGDLEVIVRYGFFREVRKMCPYRRTHYFGE